MASIKLKGDTSGEITIQAPSVAGTNTLNLQASSGTLATTAQASVGVKNLIINGDMRIDQRNGGAAIPTTSTSTETYTIDRWYYRNLVASKYTIQQNAGSVTPPTGFTNYLGCTSTSAYTVGGGEFFTIGQAIEGYNVADLDFGKATAKTFTLSFWARSSLTGTFGGVVANSGFTRNYPFTYSIPVANTWTNISITIPGDTSGTWLTTNGIGLNVRFSLGAGAAWSGTAGAWGSTTFVSATGATSVVGTNGATLYITGIQLEAGENATPFEHRMYSTELAMCQRYFESIGAGIRTFIMSGYWFSTTQTNGVLLYKNKRATPTISQYDASGASGNPYSFNGLSGISGDMNTFSPNTISPTSCAVNFTITSGTRTAGEHANISLRSERGYYIHIDSEL